MIRNIIAAMELMPKNNICDVSCVKFISKTLLILLTANKINFVCEMP